MVLAVVAAVGIILVQVQLAGQILLEEQVDQAEADLILETVLIRVQEHMAALALQVKDFLAELE